LPTHKTSCGKGWFETAPVTPKSLDVYIDGRKIRR